MKYKVVDPKKAAKEIPDHCTVCVGGAGAGHAVPDRLLESIGKRYLKEGHPRNLTIVNPCGVGDNAERGLNHIAYEGLVRRVIGGFWGNAPKMVKLALENKVEGYNFPQGVLTHLMRASAAGETGLLSRTGLHTFVDPRLEAGRINEKAGEDLVQLVHFSGDEYLFYRAIPIDVGLIRGTSIDVEGNLLMEEEVGTFSMLSIAMAARRNGGKVIAQVKRVDQGHAIPANVKVPGVLIDYVVVDPDQPMTFITPYEPALVKRDAPYKAEELALSGMKKIISRRAAMELFEGAFVNLGYGMADGVPIVAKEEGVDDRIIFMIEQGAIAGIPTTGLNFGAMYNPSAIIDDGYQFDYFHGGGLDIAFLGFAQVDSVGNVNSSRFGSILTGCGGFIDITQHAKKVVFCGTFAVKGNAGIEKNKLKITAKGTSAKFVKKVQQITFSGSYALEKKQEVLYVTERAVFQLIPEGLRLVEIAPGADLDRDILDLMEFRPQIPNRLKAMDRALFSEDALNLRNKMKRG